MKSVNQQPLISIIVPVYKVEQYLDRCVESIVNQTYTNLEIILVDDGSPDNCPAMCDAWAERDPRIRVIHKENGGLSDARNAGMALANGELMGFVDGDDYISNDMYQSLYENMSMNDSDISSCGVKKVWENTDESEMLTVTGEYILDNTEAMLATIEETYIKQPVWYKLYKTDLIKDILFPVGKYHEDVFWTYLAVANAQKVSIFDKTCYFYSQRLGSIMDETYSIKRLDSIQASQQRCEFIAEKYPKLVGSAQTRFIGMCMYHGQKLLDVKLEGYKSHFEDLHTRAENIGNQWKHETNLPLKQKLWLNMYLSFPKLTCKVRNILRMGT